VGAEIHGNSQYKSLWYNRKRRRPGREKRPRDIEGNGHCGEPQPDQQERVHMKRLTDIPIVQGIIMIGYVISRGAQTNRWLHRHTEKSR